MIDSLINESGGNVFLSNIRHSYFSDFEYVINFNAVGNKKYIISCREDDKGKLYVNDINIIFELSNPYFIEDFRIDVHDDDLYYSEDYPLDCEKTPTRIINSISKEIYNFRENLHEFINNNIR